MAAPVISWRSQDNSQAVSAWDSGIVDAGTTSKDFGVLIWNNYKGSTDLATMTNCTVTTKDSAGGNTGELVQNQWVQVLLVSKQSGSETSRTNIGGSKTHPIEAAGTTQNSSGASIAGANEILGVANDGQKDNSKGNFAELLLRLDIPGNATSGNIDFLTRVSYQFT
ncbi:hypothetical protein ACQKEX_14880 [Bacillus pumilus]|uniref:hypothetical protein n=1 Tax=Bacillus TaxID=1386 RepID=UPI00095BE6D6|nr:hypothetical protein [Bacillus pumilus]MBU8576383.1 hypothetical protein [Bacillus pumilus]OLP64418.1 hypothetical protein BACPU_26430 [Bacillus pumilus]